jgi:hypothetical protein
MTELCDAELLVTCITEKFVIKVPIRIPVPFVWPKKLSVYKIMWTYIKWNWVSPFTIGVCNTADLLMYLICSTALFSHKYWCVLLISCHTVQTNRPT